MSGRRSTEIRSTCPADAIHDHQSIHVDPERARSGPFGQTIAHGLLNLALLQALLRVEAARLGVNYGLTVIQRGTEQLSREQARGPQASACGPRSTIAGRGRHVAPVRS